MSYKAKGDKVVVSVPAHEWKITQEEARQRLALLVQRIAELQEELTRTSAEADELLLVLSQMQEDNLHFATLKEG